jgi:Zn-finger nucleic acid-binding protein
MTETPDDLLSLMEVLKTYKPRRKWWMLRVEEGDIAAYRVPGTRGIWLSRADIERLLRPQRLEIRPKPKEETTE